MDHSATFARLFSRLVSLLIHDAHNVDQQKVTLRAAVAVGKQGPVRLTVREGELMADDEPMPTVLPGVSDVAARMAACGLREIIFEASPRAAAVLDRARELAGGRMNGSGVAEPVAALAPLTEFAVPEAARNDQERGPEREAGVPGLVSEDISAMFFQFSAIGAAKDSPETLVARLETVENPSEAIRLLDGAVTQAETAAREGKPAVVADLMYGVVRCERSAADEDVKRAYVLALRRMSRQLTLRPVAALMSRDPERRAHVVEVLARTGQDGAEALIDQMTQAQTTEDRQAMFDVLMQLDAAVPALINMLGDARWFVARNAADLLAEMKPVAAESSLVGLLHHPEGRVRRSATNALMQLGTESARQAVRAAVRDPEPEVRMQAAFAIAAHRDPETAATLITAIDKEADTDVQLAMLLALGRVGTLEAVQRLIRAAEPEHGLFKKKATAVRVAAVQALASVNSAAARDALKALASDRDKDVRDTVARLAQQNQRP
ncbi:MAG: HEAT repeat domain-containing protein [Gemmatimonadaceae bacterium]|nr:HEAT repeat domain-containing protein [Gemmatimonadaceae bacterium]